MNGSLDNMFYVCCPVIFLERIHANKILEQSHNYETTTNGKISINRNTISYNKRQKRKHSMFLNFIEEHQELLEERQA